MTPLQRFGADKGENPAPGTYNDPRTALESTKRITGLKRSPFSQTSVRFSPEHHIKKTPGGYKSTERVSKRLINVFVSNI